VCQRVPKRGMNRYQDSGTGELGSMAGHHQGTKLGQPKNPSVPHTRCLCPQSPTWHLLPQSPQSQESAPSFCGSSIFHEWFQSHSEVPSTQTEGKSLGTVYGVSGLGPTRPHHQKELRRGGLQHTGGSAVCPGMRGCGFDDSLAHFCHTGSPDQHLCDRCDRWLHPFLPTKKTF
jgi:hypothetical protein